MKMRIGKKKRLGAGRMLLPVLFLAVVCAGGSLLGEQASAVDFSAKNLPPQMGHLFGTDWMGRDMLARTLKGLSTSILLGILAASVSAGIAVLIGLLSALAGKTADRIASLGIDLMMGIPHILLLLLISIALGKGFRGVAAGVALTHWPSLARVIRAEVIQLREQPYIAVAGKLGKSRREIVARHIVPHLLPQFLVGLVLLFPHVILHEASITFLGFGLSAGQPAIGNILSESMQYLIGGKWWLAVFPGLMLTLTVGLFYRIGETLRQGGDRWRCLK